MMTEIRNTALDVGSCMERESSLSGGIRECTSVSPKPRADQLDLSSVSESLRSSGLGSVSFVASSQESLRFDLTLQSSRTETANASGWYAREEKSLQLSLSYSMTRSVLVNGILEQRKFQIDIQIAAKNVEEAGLKPFQQTEDITHFLRRVVDDIFDVSRDDSKLLQGVVFDLKDLTELAGMEKGKVLKMISQFVQMVQFLARMRQWSKSEGEGELESVMLHPERAVASGVEGTYRSERQLDIQVSIQESATSSAAQTGAVTPASAEAA
jgi:hypothetical protein